MTEFPTSMLSSETTRPVSEHKACQHSTEKSEEDNRVDGNFRHHEGCKCHELGERIFTERLKNKRLKEIQGIPPWIGSIEGIEEEERPETKKDHEETFQCPAEDSEGFVITVDETDVLTTCRRSAFH